MCRSSACLFVAFVLVCVAFGGCPSVSGQPTPVIWTIRGCAATVGNATSDCRWNQTIWLRGSNLPTGNVSVQLAYRLSSDYYTYYYATNVVSYNGSVVSARLPYIPISNWGNTYTVQLRNNTVVSSTSIVANVTYWSQSPYVSRVTGCPVNDPVTNTTSGCQQGSVITIEGQHSQHTQ